MKYVLVLLFGGNGGLVAGNHNSFDNCDHAGKLSKQTYVCIPFDAPAATLRPKTVVPTPKPAPAPPKPPQ